MLLITSHFILWLLQTSCSIFIDVACYNHSRVFYACCTISMHITVILVVMLKSAILLPKNSMCPILPLNKNYLRNYLEPKNYLGVPKWQDDSCSGNCWRQYTPEVVYCLRVYMCSRLGGASRLTVRVAPPALREGHPTSAIPVEYTCIREGK